MISLHEAPAKGHEEMVEILHKAGSDVNAEDKQNMTPLHRAAASGDTENVRVLLKAGSDVNSEDYMKWTPLCVAVDSGHKEIVEILLTAGANINAKDEHKWTPVYIAVAYGHKNIVEILLKAGANIIVEDYLRCTPLHVAVAYGHKEIVEILLKAGANINAEDYRKWTPLHAAVAYGHKEIVEILLKVGANANVRDEQNMTLIHSAAAGGYTEIVGILLQAGASLDTQCRRGYTPLYYSKKNRHHQVSLYLQKYIATTGRGVWQRINRNVSSPLAIRTMSHTQTEIAIERRKSADGLPRHSGHKDNTVVSSEGSDIHTERNPDQAFPHGLSLQDSKDIRKQVEDHWARFSLQYKSQQGHCSSGVTSVLKDGNIAVIHSPINIMFSSKTVHNYQQETLQITHADIVNMKGTVNLIQGQDTDGDNDAEDNNKNVCGFV